MTGVEQNDFRLPRNMWLVYSRTPIRSAASTVFWGWFLDCLGQGLKNPKLSNFMYSLANSQFFALQLV